MVLLLKFIQVGLVAAALPKDLKVTDSASVQGVSKAIAADAMSYYKGTAAKYVDLTPPYWWWQMGALSGAMLDYSHYTGDKSYDDVIATALLAQVGPEFNYMSPAHSGQLGNDDLGFWGFAVMAAAERNFPQPPSKVPSWLKMGENIFNSLASRWDTTSCGGGLPWQIYKENPHGINYKNSVSNAAFFQLAARLARATGNETYVEWANKVYDWSRTVGFVDANFHVIDGADRRENCQKLNMVSFTYTSGVYLYGAAVMANYTDGNKTWTDRVMGFVESQKQYFGPADNATNVLYEPACELVGTCNVDMKSHKGQLARFMWASTLMVPAIAKP
ncbi:mannan endo-1,6-alpha-mannosidase DCW1, partial [Magnaporthiopsis poae ATCC 64411]